MPIKFRIIWGRFPDDLSSVSEYEFATQAEVDVFWEGVYAAEGWDGFTELEDGDVVPENEGCVTIGEDGEVIILDAAGNHVEHGVSRF